MLNDMLITVNSTLVMHSGAQGRLKTTTKAPNWAKCNWYSNLTCQNCSGLSVKFTFFSCIVNQNMLFMQKIENVST